MSPNHLWSSCGCLSLIALLAACSNDTVNLGGGRAPLLVQPGERCSGPSIVQGPVTVHDQDEIEQLAGCEEIDGDLHIEIFEDADLTPLSSLRIVDGLLEIGAYPERYQDLDKTEDLIALSAEVDQTVADGYLSSLSGLEGLQRAGALQLTYIAAEDLEPLLGLRQLDSAGPFDISLDITSAANLRDLQGLSNVESIQNLSLSSTPALTSLGGIRVANSLVNISLMDTPLLSSIAELESVASASSLTLAITGLTDLDSLANLGSVDGPISITGNPLLQNVDGLGNVFTARSLFVAHNPVLEDIPSLREVSGLDQVTVVDNPELRSLHLDLPDEGIGPTTLQGSSLTNPITLIDIGQNDHLTELWISAALKHGRAIAVYDNAALLQVSLGALERLEQLTITGNATLAQVHVGSLRTVDQLLVTNNPMLDDTQLEKVRTFSSTVGRNAASP